MRSVHKATLSDVNAIRRSDTEFAYDGRNELAERATERGCGYVLVQDRQVIGIGILEYNFFEQGFISLLYVSPEVRRSGAGRMLLQYLVSVCETPKLFSSTNQSNAPMQALFRQVGFAPSGIIQNLDPNDPEIVYYKSVTGEGCAVDESPK